MKFLCGRCSSPAVRLRSQKVNSSQKILRSSLNQLHNGKDEGNTSQPVNGFKQNGIGPTENGEENMNMVQKTVDGASKPAVNGNLPLKNGQPIRNKFTEGKEGKVFFFLTPRLNLQLCSLFLILRRA